LHLKSAARSTRVVMTWKNMASEQYALVGSLAAPVSGAVTARVSVAGPAADAATVRHARGEG
jgi:hypothetical protein